VSAVSAERLRILHILPKLTVSGAENMATYLMLGLSSSHDVGAVSLYPRANTTIEKSLSEAGIPVWYLGKRRGFDASMFLAIDKVLRTFRPHVVHSHLSILRYALPSMILRRIPVSIHTLHNMAEYEVGRFGRVIHRLAFRWNVVPVAISREVEHSFERVYGASCGATIPNGIPVEKYAKSSGTRETWRRKLGLNEDAVLFLSVGRLDTQKNPWMLMKAFAGVSDPRSHLIFVGDGYLLPQLRETVRAKGLDDRVHFLGERFDIADCLAAADIFVLTSNWEGNPLSVMEAMASGLPVIATAVGGVPELVENAGILVDAGDSDRFADAMRDLLRNPRARALMGSASRARALSRFRVEQMTEAYETLYMTHLRLHSGQFSPAASVLAGARRE
jgi:glycosyltransferase involved in cell wall biosynthesis